MLADEEREALMDLLQSYGWTVLWSKVIAPKLKNADNEAFAAIRKRDHDGAIEAVSKRDGAVQVAFEAFLAVKESPPPFIQDLRRA